MFRFLLKTADKVGMVADVTNVLKELNIDILSMEVEPHIIFLKLPELSPERKKELFDSLLNLRDIHQILTVELLPFEEKTQEFELILQNIDYGIITIGRIGNIKYWNKNAAKLFSMRKRSIPDLNFFEIFKDEFIKNAIDNGKVVKNYETFFELNGKIKKVYLSCGALRDERDRIVGTLVILSKPEDVIRQAYEIRKPYTFTFEDFVATSESIRDTLNKAMDLSESDEDVLIIGEKGTGKELLAKAIHNESYRSQYPFVTINCASLSNYFLEFELFGYEGLFLKSSEEGSKIGLLELANGGTLFINEISHLSPMLQEKLFRAKENGKFIRPGGEEEIELNVRIIASCSPAYRDLIEKEVLKKFERSTLFMPPLRERLEEIEILSEYVIEKLEKIYKRGIVGLEKEAISMLSKYEWPGNLRELQWVLESAYYRAKGKRIEKEDIDLDRFKKFFTTQVMDTHGGEIATLKEVVEKAERELLEKAMERYKSTRKMGKALGVSHTTIAYKLKQYGLMGKK